MKRKTLIKFVLFFLAGLMVAAASASAQSIAYRQHNLASDVFDFADNTDPFLLDPWEITVDPSGSFIVANSVHGRVISLDAAGVRSLPPGFSVPNPAGTAPAIPTGIVANPDSLFRDQNHIPPFLSSSITATADGGIYFWAVNADETFLPQATLVVDHSQLGASYAIQGGSLLFVASHHLTVHVST